MALQFRKFGNDLADKRANRAGPAGAGRRRPGDRRRRRPAHAWRARLGVAPYLLFLLVYWHYEERYFAFLLPWVGILACGQPSRMLLARVFERGDGIQRRLAIGVVALGWRSSWRRVQFMVNQATSRLLPTAGDVVVGEWIARNTPQEGVSRHDAACPGRRPGTADVARS